jgi:DMSO reductase family type II enzyme molybdopterin subunit
MPAVTRRGFLLGMGAGVGAAAIGLSLVHLRRKPPTRGTGELPPAVAHEPIPAYEDFKDLYRRKWTWDRVAKGTHLVNCWYQKNCNWNVYVKDGIALREEQAATYAPINSDVPDYNPRGCQKGACYTQRMYDAGRLRHPLRRVGARGEGRWKRISWEEGLREIADLTIDALVEDGPGSVTWDPGTANANGCNGIGIHRTGFVLDTPIIDVNTEVGDHHPGALATCGKISFASSGDDVFYSDLILIWGGNPVYTQIPNAHFINEARYHGAEVVTIAPDYCASAIHADQWIPVEAGSDAALGLSMAQVIVEEGLYDTRFIIEQTDMPLLVHEPTGRFLRQSDLENAGDDDVFYVFDRGRGGIREAPKKSLELGDGDPTLEGEHRVAMLGGEVVVTTVFELLRKQLAKYPPEAAEKITGIHAGLIRSLARRIAKAKAATMIAASSFGKNYHGLEMERAQFLVFTLCGQIGRKGSGITGFPALHASGATDLIVAPGNHSPTVGRMLVSARAAPSFVKASLEGTTDEMFLYEMVRDQYRKGGSVSAHLYFTSHLGSESSYARSADWDPAMKRSLHEYLAEAYEKGWQIEPSRARPRIFFACGGNILRRTRGYHQVIEKLLPRLDLLVTLDVRMSTTALYSDYVFPAAGWYEKDDLTWATPIAPYAHVTTRAVDPIAESKTDWEFHCLFLKEVQHRARERGAETFVDRSGGRRRLDRVYDEFTFQGRFTEDNPEALMRYLFERVTNLGGVSWDAIKKKGFERFTELGLDFINIGNATDIEPNETITANTWHTENKKPWPTLTRRMQFYIDHPFYLELGEQLPVHKDPPPIGGGFPLKLVNQHVRWSIHASWRDVDDLLRLQRGEPLVILSREDATTRGARLERDRRLRGEGKGLGRGAARRCHREPRLGAVSIPPASFPRSRRPQPLESAAARRRLYASAARVHDGRFGHVRQGYADRGRTGVAGAGRVTRIAGRAFPCSSPAQMGRSRRARRRAARAPAQRSRAAKAIVLPFEVAGTGIPPNSCWSAK